MIDCKFDWLDDNAKQHCLEEFKNKITPYDNGDNDNATPEDMEYTINEWLSGNELIIDDKGNWIDVDNLVTELLKVYNTEYSRLYDSKSVGYNNCAESYNYGYGNAMIKSRYKYWQLLVEKRGDIFSSDREVSALGYALSNIENIAKRFII